MVPEAVIFQVRQARVPAVLAVHHMMRLATRGGLVAAAGELAPLVPQGHQPAQVDRDVVGLALVLILYLFWDMDRSGNHLQQVAHHACG